MKKIKKIIGLAIVSTLLASVSARADQEQDEVNKQIAKLIGDAISTRVAADAAPESNGKPPNSAYGDYSHIGVHVSGFSSNTNLILGGYDREITPNLVLGAAVTYNHTGSSNVDAWSITPYAAYRFNESFFAIGRIGYSETNGDNFDSHATSVAASINGVHDFGSAYVQGRLEIGGNESRTKTSSPFFGNSSTSNRTTTYTGDAEVGYHFEEGLKGFAGLQLQSSDEKNSYEAFARVGLEKEFNKTAAVGIKYETNVDDNLPSNTNLRINVFSINGRILF